MVCSNLTDKIFNNDNVEFFHKFIHRFHICILYCMTVCAILFCNTFFSVCVWLVHVFFLSIIFSSGILEWPFWTKLVVVAIGFTGGLVFMYVQCKVYIHLWRRLKAYNRVIYVQNRPDMCKKLALEKPPLVEINLENKEALAQTQSDTNSSQYTETEDYSMEVLHVWPLTPGHWLSYT